jgi:endonuclease YncB( thermonuclease family)
MGSIICSVIKRLNYFEYSLRLLGFQENIALLIVIAAIFSGLIIPIFNSDFASATPEEGGDTGGGDGDGDGSTSASECQGQADCFRGTVTEIVDGDTLDVNNVRVRLALVNTPERGENGYTEAIDFVQSVCSVGTTALVDEDDGQKEGSFDRVIGLVYCGGDNINNKKSLNELLLELSNAVIYQDFCGISEFSLASWAQRYGCR